MIEAPSLWLPRRELWIPELEIACTNRMRGRYKLDVVRSDGTIRKSTGWIDNVITNVGLDNIGNHLSSYAYCHCGTGSTTPAVTDTGLTTWLASTNNVTASSAAASGTSPYMGYYQATYRFAAGTATGNISEVGIGPNSGNTQMFSHALVLDGGGSPTTITVLSTEALDVTYQIQNFPPLVDVTGGSLTLTGATGSPFSTTVRASHAGSAGNWSAQFPNGGMYYGSGYSLNSVYATQTLGAITANPAGTGYSVPSPTNQAYTNGNYYQDATLSFALIDGNAPGGVGSADLWFGPSGCMGSFQVSFSGTGAVPIPKDSSHIMTWYVRHTWARYP
jgi:hypothetical protein